MKISTATLALLAAPFASAATFFERGDLVERGALTELPSCAQSATEAGISATGCKVSDFACICGNSQFVTSLHNLIDQACSVADQQVTLAFAQQVCSAVNVPLNIPTPGATTSSVVPPTSSASVPSAINKDIVPSSASSYPTTIPTPSAPYAFANGTSSINGTNNTIPFTGGAAEHRPIGYQLAGSAVMIAVVMGVFL